MNNIQMLPENHKCEMVRQSQQQHFVDHDKLISSRNRNKTKKMELDWSHAENTSINHYQTSPDMESTREEEKRTAKKHLAARHGVGREEDGVHRAGNCHHGAMQDPVESFHRWPMILPASRRA